MAVEAAIRLLGWRVEFCNFLTRWGKTERFISGATEKETRTVWIKQGERRQRLLFLLLHEAGHVISYQRGYGKYRRLGWTAKRQHRQSEQRAYFYGWALAKRLGISFSKRAWRRFNWEIY